MRPFLFLILTLFHFVTSGQALSEVQRKTVNNYIQYVNDLTADINGLGPSFLRYYSFIPEYRKNPSRPMPAYTCGLSAKSYYYEEAKKTASGLNNIPFVAKAESVGKAYQAIDATCKSIEIYFRLKDYEADKFKKLEELLTLEQQQVIEYSNRVKDLQAETEKIFNSQSSNASAYYKADKLMRDQLVFEKQLIDSWTFNLAQDIHTGWPNEIAQKHILDDNKKIASLNQAKPALQYPASSQFSSFIESIESLQASKRTGVDGYTFEEQQSDRHSNNLYSDLINYYNNAAVSFYNNYLNMARPNGYQGFYYLIYPAQFAIRTDPKKINTDVVAFGDKPVVELNVSSSANAIAPAVFKSLSNYVDFINEGVAQINNAMNPMRGLNGDANHVKETLASEGRLPKMDFYYKNFELPVTLYQQTMAGTKALPVAYQKSLTDQTEVLYSILTEMNQWNNALLADAALKQLNRDSANHVYAAINRYKILIETFDQKKERLFGDVRKIFQSYKVVNPGSSWVKSGNGLRELLDADYNELVKAKKFLTGDLSATRNSELIGKLSRELIINEFSNLAGIEKLGRYNGNCPYSPYEDLANYSKEFPAKIERESGHTSEGRRHPYNELIYTYNQTLVYPYNKFASLSKVPLLQSIDQLELFEVRLPKKVQPRVKEKPVAESTPEVYVPEVVEEQKEDDQNQTDVIENSSSVKSKVGKNRNNKKSETSVASGGVVHDTVRITDIIRIETVRNDTVFISKTDTVYVGLTGGETMSMDGYATNNMVLLLDVSGSMNTADKLPLLKKSILLLLKMMREEDQVSIVTYSGKVKIELPPTSFKEEDKITRVIDRLRSEGKTDGNTGIKTAYQVADKNYIRGGNNRIVLATDGEFSISKEVFGLVEKFAREDIFLSVFNFGKSTGSTKNLQQLSSSGKGNYEYITRENVDLKLIREVKAKKRK